MALQMWCYSDDKHKYEHYCRVSVRFLISLRFEEYLRPDVCIKCRVIGPFHILLFAT